MIKYRNIIVKIPTLPHETSKELQKYIYSQYELLSTFFTEDNASTFSTLKFDYTLKEIEDIYGRSDVYNCKWDKVIQESKFTLKNTSDVLLYILTGQLNKFLLLHDFKSEKEDLTGKSAAIRTVAEFIITIFDIILSDDEIFDMSGTELDKYTTTIYFDQRCDYEKKMDVKYTKADKILVKSEIGTGVGNILSIDEWIEKDEAMVSTNYEDEDRALDETAKEKLGEDATPDQVEAFKERFYKEKHAESYIYHDEFDMLQPKEGPEILEIGDDYGLMPQGTENEGDGISVYSETEWTKQA